MTLALPTPTQGRHRLGDRNKPCIRVQPPRDYRPTSHRRRRTELMQVSVYDLTARHSIARKPWWYRASAFLATWFANAIEPASAR